MKDYFVERQHTAEIITLDLEQIIIPLPVECFLHAKKRHILVALHCFMIHLGLRLAPPSYPECSSCTLDHHSVDFDDA